VSAALELLRRLSEIGAAAIPAGDKLVVRAGKKPVPGELVRTIRDRKAELLAALVEAAEWRARHREALARWSALHPADEAAGIAWGELQDRWHRLRGERLPEWQCAGWRGPIGGREALALGDGARVHFDTLDCLLAYGERWRGTAARALAAMDLPAPGQGEVIAGSKLDREHDRDELIAKIRAMVA
jgi:hypothetical protein